MTDGTSTQKVESFIRKETYSLAKQYLYSYFTPLKKYYLVKIDSEWCEWLMRYHGIIYYASPSAQGYYWLSSNVTNNAMYVHASSRIAGQNEYDKLTSSPALITLDLLDWKECFLTKNLVRQYNKIIRRSIGVQKFIDRKEEKYIRDYYRDFSSMDIDNIKLLP